MKHYRDYMDRQAVSSDLHARLMELETPEKKRNWTGYVAMAACFALLIGVGAWKVLPSESVEDGRPVVTDTQGNGEVFINIVYPDLTTSRGHELSSDIALPEGGFTEELTEEQLSTLLWGEMAPQTFWEDYTVTAHAWYDGNGDLWQLEIFGERDFDEFRIVLAPEKLPPACVVRDGAKITEVNGVEVSAWKTYYDRNGDDVKEHVYESAFLTETIGVRCQFVSHEESRLSDAFINWATSGNVDLAPILKAEDVPAFRSVEFETYAEALGEEAYAKYLPQTAPAGYGDFRGHLTWQEGRESRLWVAWSRGYDDVRVFVDLPEAGEPECDVVDVNVPESYDVRLYDIPWCDSVPEEYRQSVNCPTFRAEDMSREVVAARQNEKDTGGYRFLFQVLHEDGTLVEYDLSGVTVDYVWSLVKATL